MRYFKRLPAETESSRKIRWCLLPYGMWITRDGRQVIFNRNYRPLWQRDSFGGVARANPGEFVRNWWQVHFYHDGTVDKSAQAIRAWEEFTSRKWCWKQARADMKTIDPRLRRHSMSPDWVHEQTRQFVHVGNIEVKARPILRGY